MTLLFGFMMVLIAKRINDVRITSLKLRFQNSGLVSYLATAKEKSDKLNEKLLLEVAERERIAKELRNSEGHLRYLSAELLSAHEKERRLVAQEIHDSIGASLAGAKFKMQDIFKQVGEGRPQTRALLESIMPMIQGTIDEARRIQMALRPPILDDLGILPTLHWFCREFETTYSGIHINMEIHIQEDVIPDSLKTVIYRVSQEALNNIAKHSKANEVSLSLVKIGQVIKLAIRDNGQGFDPAAAHSHSGAGRGLGLESMRERVELSGGAYSIESSEGAGTVVRASWPLPR
jgi:signal transduction histidine kinase